MLERIILARPRGFCAGVDRAIDIVQRALARYGAPVYVKHAIVHNRHVVARLERMGAVFVEELSQVPSGARVIFSAHGVSPAVRREAQERGLLALDATCPLVTKVHMEAKHYAQEGRTILLIGHKDHVEVQGTLGEAPAQTVVVENAAEAATVAVPDPERVAYLTQTTLSVDDTQEIVGVLKNRFPALATPRKEDICYATQNRQRAVKALAQEADVILVVGSANSSNSRRLVEVAQVGGQQGGRQGDHTGRAGGHGLPVFGLPAYLVDAKEHLEVAWLSGAKVVGVSAGASAPEDVVADLVAHLRQVYGGAATTVEEREVVAENMTFPLPAELSR